MAMTHDKPLAERIEDAIRKAISGVDGIYEVSELAYCEAVKEALDAVAVGNDMRIEELDPEDTDDG